MAETRNYATAVNEFNRKDQFIKLIWDLHQNTTTNFVLEI